MDKSKTDKRSSVGSSSRRSYGFLRTIINLSPSRVRSESAKEVKPPQSVEEKSKTPNDTNSIKRKLLHGAPQESGNQSPSSCSTTSSSGGGMSLLTPMGPAPRTFSILAALNEIAISDNKLDTTRNRKYFTQSETNQNENEKGEISRNKTGNQTGSSDLMDEFHSTINVENNQAAELRGNINGSRSVRSRSYTPSQYSLHQKNSNCDQKSVSLKDRVPEWIVRIFQSAKMGRLQDLKECLSDLDRTMIRHLVDTMGNTVLHTAARGGYIHMLQWLVTTLGPLAELALSDQNKARRTVILTALKAGQQECFQWLVLNTKTGDMGLVPNDGEKSLLHYAATYRNSAAVRWLSKLIREKGHHVDIQDASGLTPLHMAAKSGSVLVCHDLIIAGANPLSQTKLGRRSVDFALKHRREECTNYFMMAETAASVGNELHTVIQEYHDVKTKHEFLLTHFRDLLRVGKWLVKERSDMLKNFPSGRSQSSSDVSLLLGSLSNGTRLSDLEHKLVQAEQAWKDVHSSKKNYANDTPEDQAKPYRFYESLDITRFRREKTKLLTASSSSDEESCQSRASSSDDDYLIHPYLRINKKTNQFNQRSQENQATNRSSNIAPWLIPLNDGFLERLSPFGGQRDPLEKTQTTKGMDSSEQSSAAQPNFSFGSTHQDGTSGSNKDPAVLEVIEPISSPIKGAYLTPDLIREAKSSVAGVNIPSFEGSDRQRLESRTGSERRDLFSETKSPTYSTDTTSFKSDTPTDELLKPSQDFQHSLKNLSIPFTRKSYNHYHHHSSTSTSIGNYNPSTFNHGESNCTLSNSGGSIPNSFSEVQFIIPCNSSCKESPRKSSLSQCSANFSVCSDNPLLLANNTEAAAGATSSLRKVAKTRARSIVESTKIIFPVFTTVEFSPAKLMSGGGSQDEINCGPSSQALMESVSRSNTPVMGRSYSSGSRSSGTVFFPIRKGNWASSEYLSSISTNNGPILTGRNSPSASEASRTESALAPPPSNASHASHNSETSKTESAREIPLVSEELEQPVFVHNDDGSQKASMEGHSLSMIDSSVVTVSRVIENVKRTPGESDRKNSEEETEVKVEMMTLTSAGPSSLIQGNIHKNNSSINHPLVSSEILKASIQRLSKNGKGRKPWYEIEGSDDDEPSLLQKARSQSSRSSKLSAANVSGSGSENGLEACCPNEEDTDSDKDDGDILDNNQSQCDALLDNSSHFV